MTVRSVSQYERYIDERLDPFEVTMQRNGLRATFADFSSVEKGYLHHFGPNKIPRCSLPLLYYRFLWPQLPAWAKEILTDYKV
jgi:hypothetical protein